MTALKFGLSPLRLDVRSAIVAGAFLPIIVVQAAVCLATLSFQFFLWDYFAAIQLYPGPDADTLGGALAGWWRDLRTPEWIFRPSYTLYVGIEYWLFGSAFWAYYLVKWVLYVVACWLAYTIVREFGGRRLPAAAAALLFASTACHPVLMLFSADLLSIVLPMAMALMILRFGRGDVARLGWKSYTAVCVVCFLAVGVKEISFLITGIVVASSLAFHGSRVLADRNALRRTWRFLIPAALVVWAMMRAYAASQLRSSESDSNLLNTLMLYAKASFGFALQLGWFGYVVAAVVALTLVVWGVRTIKSAAGPSKALIGLSIACGFVLALTLALSVLAPFFAARYAVPAVFAGAVALGLAGSLWGRVEVAALGIAFVASIANAGDIARQTIAYQIHGESLWGGIAKAQELAGRKPIGVDFSHPEWGGSFLSGSFAEHRAKFGVLSQPVPFNGNPYATSVILSNRIGAPLPGWDATIYAVSEFKNTPISKLERLLTQFDDLVFRASATTYDAGAPALVKNGETNLPSQWGFFVTMLTPKNGSAPSSELEAPTVCAALSPDPKSSMISCDAGRAAFKDLVVLAIPLIPSEPLALVQLNASIESNRTASIWVGLRHMQASDIAAVPVQLVQGQNELSIAVPADALEAGKAYELFIFSPAQQDLALTISKMTAPMIPKGRVIDLVR